MTVYLNYKLPSDQEKLPLIQSVNRQLRLVWQRTPLYHIGLMGKSPQVLKIIPTDPWPGDINHGRLILDGKMLLGQTVVSLDDLWHIKGLSSQQHGQLHGFEWLRDLRSVGDNMARRLARHLILNWIEKNQNWKSSAWTPDSIGYRLANWIGLYDFFCASADDSFRRVFFKSVARQTRHLLRNWSDGKTSLHRFYGLYGLIFSVVCLSQETQQLPKLLNQLSFLLKQQILADGGHVTRSPIIQLIVLRMLIDIRSILRFGSISIPDDLQKCINKMAPLVRLFRHGDGGLASFDGHMSFSPNLIDMILSLADVRGKPPERAVSMGYERCVTKAGLVLFNTAPSLFHPFPTTVDRGTGILNFEWSIGRERIITTGDVVLQTSDESYLQAQKKDPDLLVQRKIHDRDIFIEATYHSSKPSGSFHHCRQIYLNGDSTDLRGEDRFNTASETIFAIRFILSPNLQPQLSNSGKNGTFRLADGRIIRFVVAGHEEMTITTLSERHEASCILIMGRIPENEERSIKWAFREI